MLFFQGMLTSFFLAEGGLTPLIRDMSTKKLSFFLNLPLPLNGAAIGIVGIAPRTRLTRLENTKSLVLKCCEQI